MKKHIRTIAVSLVIILSTLIGLSGAVASAQGAVDSGTKTQICTGIGLTGGNCTNGSGQSGVTHLVQTIVSLLSWAVGIIAVIMLIVAGLKYITAAGSSEKLTSAKHTLIYALVGIAIVALAQFLISFTYNTATSGLCKNNPGTPANSAQCK